MPTITAEAENPATTRSQRFVLAVAILGSSMAYIDNTGVNVSMPALQQYFHATGSQTQWIVEIYAIFSSSLLLVGGALGDVLGRKRAFVSGLCAFAAASVCCGLAQTLTQLIIARAMQGIGAAFLIPGSLALISGTFPHETRGRAIGTWSGFTAITAALGPLIGGWLVQHASWRLVFFINLPLALASLIIATRVGIEAERTEKSGAVDWYGALLATGGLGAITYALIETSAGSRSALPIGFTGIVLLAAFVMVEIRSPRAMLPMSMFRSRNFSGANLMTLFLYAGLGGMFYYLPLNLMQVQHYPPQAAGAALLPLIFCIFLLSRWSGGLVQRHGARLPLIVGPLIAAAGFVLLALPGLDQSYWKTFFPAVIVLGLGLAVSVAPLTTVVMTSLSQEQSGSASGVNNATSQVGSLLAIALCGILITASFERTLDHRLRSGVFSQQTQQSIWAERKRLAAIETNDPAAEQMIRMSFVVGFRELALFSAGMALISSCAAAILVRNTDASQTQ